MRKNIAPSSRLRRLSDQRGLSLVELMVAVVIGLVVTGAVMVTYLSTSSMGKLQTAYSEMNENAQLAFGVLSRDLLLAGYSAPNAAAGTVAVNVGGVVVTTINRNYGGRAVFGCNAGFVSATVAGEATCNASGASPSIEISYEADFTNTVPSAGPPSVPTDCLGNAITISGTFFLVRNRYYVADTKGRPNLHCASSVGNTGQPIVENIESLQIRYGVALAAAPTIPVRYVDADGVAAAEWPRVVSVRICAVVRGSEAVLSEDDIQSYINCDGNSTAITDRIARRAYSTTVALRNRVAF